MNLGLAAMLAMGCASETGLREGLAPPTTVEDSATPQPVPPLQPGDTGWDDDDVCDQALALDDYLDTFQESGDGKVVYCHRGGGENWTLVESDISACLPHLNHRGDVFPTTGCDS